MRVELSTDPAAPSSAAIRLAWLACVLGFAHAAFSAYWALGGRCLLATVGQCAVAAAEQSPVRAGLLLGVAGPALYGGFNVAVASAVLGGLIRPQGRYDRAAMIGHAALWDPLFLAWGSALLASLWLSWEPGR